MFFLAIKTTSHPAGNKSLFRRKYSLSSRFILLLFTALPAFLDTVIPSLFIPWVLLYVTDVKFLELFQTPCR